jgi:hypothetical protein
MLLNLKLHLDVRAPINFHFVRWELLLDPVDNHPLSISPRVVFSRYLPSDDWQPSSAAKPRNMRALIVVANPKDISDWEPGGRKLQPVALDEELRRSRLIFGDISAELASSAAVGSIFNALDTEVDILYLSCYTALHGGEPILFLENQEGFCKPVRGTSFWSRFAELFQPPSLAVLSPPSVIARSDYSGPPAEEHALTTIAIGLGKVGVASVLVMPAAASKGDLFLTEFFRAYQVHGVPDKAAAQARKAIQERGDWWAPILLSR